VLATAKQRLGSFVFATLVTGCALSACSSSDDEAASTSTDDEDDDEEQDTPAAEEVDAGTGPSSDDSDEDGSSSDDDAAEVDDVDTDDSAADDPQEEIPDHFGHCNLGDASAFEPPAPSQVISFDKPVFASDGVEQPEALVDGNYIENGVRTAMGNPTEDDPTWVAIEVGEGPSHVMATWYDSSTRSWVSNSAGAPLSYRIEVSADSTDGSDGDWTEVVSVEDNPVKGRAHVFEFDGMSWIKLVATGDVNGQPIFLDELVVHDVSEDPDNVDGWFFIGDSITYAAFQRRIEEPLVFDAQVAMLEDDRYPALMNGAIGGEVVGDGLARIDQVFELLPPFRQVAIAYGTNDASGNRSPINFEAEMRELIEKVLDAGHVPIVARIGYAVYSHDTVPDFNEIIDDLQQEYELPCGPDMYTYFKNHPEELKDDGLHPNATGDASINRLWAEAASAFYNQAD
jgi:lysophospholipase L1-like esterase